MTTWRPIPGFEGFYSINQRGEVHSEHRVIQRRNGRRQTVHPRLLAQMIHRRSGLRSVHLCDAGTQRTCYVHKLIAAAFGPQHQTNGDSETA